MQEEGRLGYRDLHLFNLAMLARQGWRILQNPDSLVAQLLSVFDDRQLITGVPRTMFEGLRRTQNSTVNAKRRRVYTGSGPLVE